MFLEDKECVKLQANDKGLTLETPALFYLTIINSFNIPYFRGLLDFVPLTVFLSLN